MEFTLVFVVCLVGLTTAAAQQSTELKEDADVTTAQNLDPQTVTANDPLCGDDNSYYDSYGVIRSPNYPGNYYDTLYCDYYVYASSGSSLSFIFKSFHVQSADFVTISCLYDSNFPPQEYSGHTLPYPVSIPDCNQGRVNFRTDYTNVSSGFSIDYYVSDAGCGSTVHIGSNGYVNSPHWPDSYRYNENCSNIIWAPEQSRIKIFFHSFNLQSNCSCDWLEMSCLDNSDYGVNRYCGNYNTLNMTIHGCSQLLLSFHSDDTDNYQGFNIEYTIYSIAACGETSYYGPSGVINSPNYPGNYSNLLYCDYTIYASTGSSVTFIFTSFNVQDSFDFVIVHCKSNSTYFKHQYSGDRLPGPISFPECSQGSIELHTDHIIVSSGFSVNYAVSVEGCGKTLYDNSYGYVTSPNWPSNYGYNQDCYNIINAWNPSTFFLNFQTFILQSCCSCDWLEISCLDNSNYGPNRYCGFYDPVSTYIYNCSQVLLWFHSDGSSNDQGFNIEYSVNSSANDREVPSNKKGNARGNVHSDGETKAAENVPSNGKQNGGENIPSNGNRNAAKNVPSNGNSNAEGNAPSNGKRNAA